MRNSESTNFKQYVASLPRASGEKMKQLCVTVRAAAGDASERLAYGMPAFYVGGKMLVSFGAFKRHIGFYPGVAAVKKFRSTLAPYKTAKGSVQFPLDEALPLDLIRQIVRFKRSILDAG
ncbi:MAG TPA: DUF1801 domain-containing protein [Candidatus Tumulicola sp.]